MSKRKILSALKKKGIKSDLVEIEYVRGIPTPEGYANGWDVTLSDDLADQLFDRGFEYTEILYEFDSLSQVLEWIDSMPRLIDSNEVRP